MRLTYIFLMLVTFQQSFANLALSRGVDGSGNLASAIPLAHQSLKFSIGGMYAGGNALGVRQEINDLPSTSFAAGTRTDLALAVAYGILPYLEGSLFLPFYMDSSPLMASTSNLGDAIVSFKFNYPPYEHSKIYEMSYLFQLSLPTGSSQRKGGFVRDPWVLTRETNAAGKIIYVKDGSGESGSTKIGKDWYPYGSSSPVIILRLLNTINFSEIEGMLPMLVHFGGGLALNTDKAHENAFMFGSGVEFWLAPAFALNYGLEATVNVSNANKHIPIASFPLDHKIGATFEIPESGVQLDLGAHVSSNNLDDKTRIRQDIEGNPLDVYYYKSPKYGFFAGVAYEISYAEKDSDGDGLKDSWDRCPFEREDADGFEDDDGCPEDDNDKDGIKDKLDQCPDEAEDLDGFKDDDGCPEPDNDLDGIPDVDDTCPMEIEDKDNFEDDDGCPELDNDKDGILDNFDQCKDLAEDKDGFEDTDGCPDNDNDKDGIPDEIDKCPMKAEVLNGINDGDGCPD